MKEGVKKRSTNGSKKRKGSNAKKGLGTWDPARGIRIYRCNGVCVCVCVCMYVCMYVCFRNGKPERHNDL